MKNERNELNTPPSYVVLPDGLRFKESDLGQAVNCTKLEGILNHDDPELKTYITSAVNYWLRHHIKLHNK